MEKYIDVETLENILKFVNSEIEQVCNDGTPSGAYVAYDNVRDRLKGALLSARSDVAPVRRGAWEAIHRPDMLKCSVCCGAYRPEKWWKYCPVCGARMDGQAQ